MFYISHMLRYFVDEEHIAAKGDDSTFQDLFLYLVLDT